MAWAPVRRRSDVRAAADERAEAIAHVPMFAMLGLVMQAVLGRPDLLRDGPIMHEARVLVHVNLAA